MNYHSANISDVLRCYQRDRTFISQLEDNLRPIIKLLFGHRYSIYSARIPILTEAIYYFITSLDNRQTLGEEYTGIIRISDKKLPTKTSSVLWYILYIGGEPLFLRLLNILSNKVNSAEKIPSYRKTELTEIFNKLKANKEVFKKLHHAWFYIFGDYYHIANRLADIKYILLREWMKDDTFNKSFNILGILIFFYVLYTLIQDFKRIDKPPEPNINIVSDTLSKGCILCGENTKDMCSTYCGHIFCWNCIHESLEYSSNCPMCRQTIHSNRIIFLQNYV